MCRWYAIPRTRCLRRRPVWWSRCFRQAHHPSICAKSSWPTDASNVFGGPENIHHKWEVLRRHCEAVGRPFEEIERSTLQGVNVSRDGSGGTETPDQVIDRFGELGDAGAQHILFSVRDVWQTDKLELLGSTLLQQLREA